MTTVIAKQTAQTPSVSQTTQVQSQGKQSPLPFWRQLRWNLILYFVVLAVVPVIILQVISLSLTTQNTRSGAMRQLGSIADIKTQQIQSWIQEASNSTSLILSDASHNEKFTSLLTAGEGSDALQSEDNQILHSLVSVTAKNDQATPPIFKDLFIYDLNGNVVAGSDDALVGRVITKQPYFDASLKGAYLQPPFYAVGTGELTMVYSQPLLDPSQKIVGVLAGRLDINTLGKIMTEGVGLGNTGETYLVSAENNYLLTPSRFDGYPLNRAYHSQGIDDALQGQNGQSLYTGYRTSAGQVIGVYRWVPQLQAALLAEVEDAEALTSSSQVLTTSIIVAILAALIAVLIGFVRISQISAPIATLTQVATRIAAGDLTQRATVRESHEIGLLGDSFNRMTERLVANINELDQNLQEIDKANRALQVATAKAREAARVKGEFLANVSHELRTPLNAIIGFSDMLIMGMSGPLNPKQQHKVERLKENGSRLLTLINDLLDLTRIEAGRLEMVQKPYAPRAMVERIAAQMESLAVQTKLNFVTKIDPALPEIVIGDDKRAEQVIVNLLSNAFKFTKEGGITLNVHVNRAESTWNIDVTDTGVGIPPHALDLIFEEFRQLDGSYSRAYKGTGLGLAITRNLTRMMGGKITVKSTMGVGSTFSVVLPLVTEDAPVAELEGITA